jgi:CRP-like cAMP-binding protein
LDEIGQHADEVQVSAGRVLAKQAELGEEFIFIVDGRARVERNGKVISHLAKGDYFGEISLIDRGPRTATVIAETDLTLLVIHIRAFDHLLDTIPGLQKNMLVSLCKYLRRAMQDKI